MKTCFKCDTPKPLDQFRVRVLRGKPYVSGSCKACDNAASVARAKERYANDPEFRARMRAAQAKYNQTDKGRAAQLKGQRKYLASENGRAVTQEANRKKRKANPGGDSFYARTGHLTRHGRTPAWANLDAIKRIYVEAGRLTKETGIEHQVDHIVPLRSPLVSGLHCEANLRVLPASANASKSNLLWPDMPDDPLDVARVFGIKGIGMRVAQAADVKQFSQNPFSFCVP